MKHTYIHTHNIDGESERFGYGSVGWGSGLVWYGVLSHFVSHIPNICFYFDG